MTQPQESTKTLDNQLTPEQRLDRIKQHIVSVVSDAPNSELPLDALFNQGSIAASQNQFLGILALVEERILTVNYINGSVKVPETSE